MNISLWNQLASLIRFLSIQDALASSLELGVGPWFDSICVATVDSSNDSISFQEAQK